jgi:TetR/AcrR family transcriptional regulator, tetracycline repressor protein
MNRSPAALSRDVVVAAALEEIDRHGLNGFSLRNVAKKLGVYPTAIAWHVTSRNVLLADVVALALADILPTGFPKSWQSFLRELFQRFREAIRRHPNVAPLIGTQLIANPAQDLAFVETLLATLEHAGFRGLKMVAAYNTVMAALVGFTTQEFAPLPPDDVKAWQRQVREHLQNAAPSRYPILARNLELLSNRAFTTRWLNGTEAPFDDTFETFIDIVIAGLEHLAKRQGARVNTGI